MPLLTLPYFATSLCRRDRKVEPYDNGDWPPSGTTVGTANSHKRVACWIEMLGRNSFGELRGGHSSGRVLGKLVESRLLQIPVESIALRIAAYRLVHRDSRQRKLSK